MLEATFPSKAISLVCRKTKESETGRESEAGKGVERPSRRGSVVLPLPDPSASYAEGEGDSGSCVVLGTHILSYPGQAPSVTRAALEARVIKKQGVFLFS